MCFVISYAGYYGCKFAFEKDEKLIWLNENYESQTEEAILLQQFLFLKHNAKTLRAELSV